MNVLIVGYELEPRDEAQIILKAKLDLEPAAKPSAKKAEATEGPAQGVYLQKLKRAVITGVIDEQPVKLGPSKQAVSVAVAAFLRKHAGDGPRPKFTLIGFDVKTFLKTVGVDCSLPDVSLEFPYWIWGGHSEYQDIESLLFSSGVSHKNFGLKELHALHFALFEAAGKDADTEKAKKLFADWTGPGHDAQRDHDIAHYHAERLGVFAS